MKSTRESSGAKSPIVFDLTPEVLSACGGAMSRALMSTGIVANADECREAFVAAVGMAGTAEVGTLVLDEKRFSNLAKALARELGRSLGADVTHKQARGLLGKTLGWETEHHIAAKVKGADAGPPSDGWLVKEEGSDGKAASGEFVLICDTDFGEVVGVGRTEAEAGKVADQLEDETGDGFQDRVTFSHVTLTDEVRKGDLVLKWASSGIQTCAMVTKEAAYKNAVLRLKGAGSSSTMLAMEVLRRLKQTHAYKRIGDAFLAWMFGTPDERLDLDGTEWLVFPILTREGKVLPMTWEMLATVREFGRADGFSTTDMKRLEKDLEGVESITELLSGKDALLLNGEEDETRWSIKAVTKRLLGRSTPWDGDEWEFALENADGFEQELVSMLGARLEACLGNALPDFDVPKLLLG